MDPCRSAGAAVCRVSFFWLAICILPVGLLLLMAVLSKKGCRFLPTLALEDLSISDMTVYESNVTITAPDLPWQVDREFSITLHTRNRNRRTGCVTTFRNMSLDVKYKDERILHQEILWRFGLKSRRSSMVVVELKGDHAPLKKELGPAMEADLRSDNICLDFHFHALSRTS